MHLFLKHGDDRTETVKVNQSVPWKQCTVYSLLTVMFRWPCPELCPFIQQPLTCFISPHSADISRNFDTHFPHKLQFYVEENKVATSSISSQWRCCHSHTNAYRIPQLGSTTNLEFCKWAIPKCRPQHHWVCGRRIQLEKRCWRWADGEIAIWRMYPSHSLHELS